MSPLIRYGIELSSIRVGGDQEKVSGLCVEHQYSSWLRRVLYPTSNCSWWDWMSERAMQHHVVHGRLVRPAGARVQAGLYVSIGQQLDAGDGGLNGCRYATETIAPLSGNVVANGLFSHRWRNTRYSRWWCLRSLWNRRRRNRGCRRTRSIEGL